MKNETDTIDLLLAVALEVAEALLVLAVALVALVLTITRPRPAGSPARALTPPPAAGPLQHPLAVLAAELEALPVTCLRPMAGVTSKRHRKAELIAMVAACS